jgi:hypothetical protein
MPKWFPGTYYAEFARSMAPAVATFADAPYDEVSAKVVSQVKQVPFEYSQLEIEGRKGRTISSLREHPKNE